MDEYQKFVGASRYARWLPEEGRREEWSETVDRYVDYMIYQAETKTGISKKHLEELKEIMG